MGVQASLALLCASVLIWHEAGTRITLNVSFICTRSKPFPEYMCAAD